MFSNSVKSADISCVFLHHQHGVTGRHELLEDGREVLRHLFERQLDGFVLALVKVVDEIFDRLLQTDQLPAFTDKTRYTRNGSLF